MDYTALIQNKMSKVENSYTELNNEIFTASEYLVQLKEFSTTIVNNLSNITESATYLEEFLNINSFLLKSVTCLSEFNCKLELLGITEKSLKDFKFISKAKSSLPVVKVKTANDSEKHLVSGPIKELKSQKDKKVLERADFEQQPNPPVTDIQKYKGKKVKSQLVPCENKNNNTSATAISNDSTSNSINAFIKNDDSGLCRTKAEQNNNSSVQSTLEDSWDAVNNSEEMVPKEKVDIKVNDRKIYEPYFLTANCDKKTKQIPVMSSSDSFADILPNNTSSPNTFCTPQSSGNIPIAEVVPTKIQHKNLEESKDCNYAKDSGKDQAEVSEPIIKSKDEFDEIKPADLGRNLGEEYNVVIEYIKSPSEFYVSIIDEEKNLLEELEKKLKLIPASKSILPNKKSEHTKTVLSKEIGNYCLVYSKCDEMWYRAKIINWCLSYDDDFVNVFLLDYGESKCVSIYDLQPMPKYLKQYPAFAVQCHLYDVFPDDMDKNNSKLSWGKESSEGLRSLTEDSKKVRMRVAPNDPFHPAKSLPVTLWLVDQDNKCVNELLVTNKFAVRGSTFQETENKTEIVDIQRDEISQECTVENALTNWNPMKEDYESYKNSYDLDINDPSAIIYGYVGKDYERICRHFAKTGYCFKGAACRKEHRKLDYLGFTTDQEEVFQSAINNLPVPPPNSKLNIQVTCLLSCNKFFCFMESRNKSPAEENLQSLTQYLNTKENVLEMKKLLIPPSAGQIVIARYSVDGAWYRARVVESQPETDEYIVTFVDYGNSEPLPLSDIRAIEARYLHLPFQAIQCCIFGIERNPEIPMEEVIEYLKERIYNGHISIEVIARLPGDNINLLVNVFDKRGVSIGEDLIAKNYAICKDEMIINSNCESVPG